MRLIATICERLGISQQKLSVLICAPRITVTKAAAGERDLTYEPTMALVQLYTLIENLPAPNIIATPANSEVQAEMMQHLQECRYNLVTHKKQLLQMQKRDNQATCLLQTLSALTGNEKLNGSPRQKNWQEELQFQAEKKLAANSPAKQKKLEIEITLLYKEIELYEEAVEEGVG